MNPYRRTRMTKRGENIVGKGKSSSNDFFSLSFSELVYVHNDRESNLFIVLSTMDFSFLQSDGSNNNSLHKNLLFFFFHWFLISSDGRERINISICSKSAHTFVLSELFHRCGIPVSKWTEISEIRSCFSTYTGWIHIPVPESSFWSRISFRFYSPQHHITSEIISLICNLLPIIIVSVHTGTHSSGLKDHNVNLSD